MDSAQPPTDPAFANNNVTDVKNGPVQFLPRVFAGDEAPVNGESKRAPVLNRNAVGPPHSLLSSSLPSRASAPTLLNVAGSGQLSKWTEVQNKKKKAKIPTTKKVS